MKNRKLFILPILGLGLTLAACGNDRNIIRYNDDDPNKKVLSIALSVDHTTLDVDEVITIVPLITYKDGVAVDVGHEWRSSRPLVADVQDVAGNGVVTAKAAGATTITYMAGYKSASLTITVRSGEEPAPDPVTITLSTTVETLNVGDTFNLLATASDGSIVTLTSENELVASVNGNTVTAVGEGTTRIEAKTGDVKAYCNVTVRAVGSVTITLSTKNKTMTVGDTFTLTATASDNSICTLTSENEQIATVNAQGSVRAVAPGNTNIVARTGDAVAKCAITVNSREDDEEYDVEVYFFLDYNCFDPNDSTGKKLLVHFEWFVDRPFDTSKLPAEPTSAQAPTTDKTNFIGWSHHSLIDQKEDLWNVATDTIRDRMGNTTVAFFFGIWSDETKAQWGINQEVLIDENKI